VVGTSGDTGAVTGSTGNTVAFGGTRTASSTVVSTNPPALTTVAPAGTGTVDVTIDGGAVNPPADQYTYVPPPTVTSVSPASGPASGGTSVTITGTSFGGAVTVSFGPMLSTSFTVNSATQITALAPPGTAGAVDITVSTQFGSNSPVAADRYTYLPAPAVSSVAPSSGSAAGGTTVTITGTGFTGATLVAFGSHPATSFTVNSDTQLTAVAPAGTGTVDVTVTTAGGTSATGAADRFSYTATPPSAPTITAIGPSSGPTSGGTTVTVTGTGSETSVFRCRNR
jgi:hypothetical protein